MLRLAILSRTILRTNWQMVAMQYRMLSSGREQLSQWMEQVQQGEIDE